MLQPPEVMSRHNQQPVVLTSHLCTFNCFPYFTFDCKDNARNLLNKLKETIGMYQINYRFNIKEPLMLYYFKISSNNTSKMCFNNAFNVSLFNN